MVQKFVSLCPCSVNQRSKKVIVPINPIVRSEEHHPWYRLQIDAIDYRYVPSPIDPAKPGGKCYRWLLHIKCHFTKVFSCSVWLCLFCVNSSFISAQPSPPDATQDSNRNCTCGPLSCVPHLWPPLYPSVRQWPRVHQQVCQKGLQEFQRQIPAWEALPPRGTTFHKHMPTQPSQLNLQAQGSVEATFLLRRSSRSQ